MSYPGITFVFMISVAIGTAIYYYFNAEGRQQQNPHNAHGYRNDYYSHVNVPKPCPSKKRRKETKYEECTICLMPMNPQSTKTLSCGHMYHAQCIKKWFEVNVSCPVCRCNKM